MFSECSEIESRSFRCKKHYSGWDIVQIVAIPGSSHPLSSSIPGGLFQNRNHEINLPGIGTIAGRNFISFPLAICIKKSAKRRVYTTVFRRFLYCSCRPWNIFFYVWFLLNQDLHKHTVHRIRSSVCHCYTLNWLIICTLYKSCIQQLRKCMIKNPRKL